ncbi:MAG: hypothetical protein GWN07_37190, partial [Actinobacteria bacterium]|nr:hypothetical protein [Actinomycetota bacterium]
FNLPDMRQAFLLGQAASGTGSTLGGTGGSIDHVHGLDTTSSHARIAHGTGTPGTSRSQRKTTTTWTETHTITPNGATGTANVSVGTALGGDSDTENPPFLAVPFIVKT